MVTIISGHTDGIVDLAQDREYVYSGSKDRTLRIWDKCILECVKVIDGFPCGCMGLPYGDFLYTITIHGLKNKIYAVWQKGNWNKVFEHSIEAGGDLEGMLVDESSVYISARDGRIIALDRQTGSLYDTLWPGEQGIWDMEQDKVHLYTASVDKRITVWSKATKEVVRVLAGHRANIQALCQDEKYLYSISTDKTLIVWDKADGSKVHSYSKLYKKGMLGLWATGTHLLALNRTEGLLMWDVGDWDKPPRRFPDIRSTRVCIDQDNAYFALRDYSIAVFQRDELGL